MQIPNIEGFAFDGDGQLNGTSGRCRNHAGALFLIDKDTEQAEFLTTIDDCADIESIACFNAQIELGMEPWDPIIRNCNKCAVQSGCMACDIPTLTITNGACTSVEF